MQLTTHLRCGAAAAVLLTVAVSAAPAPSEVGCENNASDGTVYTAKNAQFDILCGIDYAGGDMASKGVSTFAECITLCDSTPGCVNVAFAPWGMCWLKDKNTTPSRNSGVWTAKSKAGLSGLTCIDNFSDKTTYTSPSGVVFEIACGIDYAGGDMAAQNTASFKECVDLCGSTAGCVDVAYSAPTCYLKNTLTAARDASHVWGAIRKDANTDPLTCEKGQWDAREFTTKDKRVYLIGCGDDYPGGDMGAVDSPSFEGCLDACDAAEGCVNVAYVAPRCYLKNVGNPPVEGTHVWGAKFLRVNNPAPPPPEPYTCNPCSPLFVNPTFDAGTTGWTSENVVRTSLSTIPRDAGSAVKVDVGYNGHLGLIQKLSTVPGTKYTLTVDYTFSAQQPNCYLNGFLNGGWFWSFSPRYDASSVGSWKTVSMEFTATECEMLLGAQFVCTAGEAVTMGLDNFQVTKGHTCPTSQRRALKTLRLA